jgi:hypothetical protein
MTRLVNVQLFAFAAVMVLAAYRAAAAELGAATSETPLVLKQGDVVAFVGGESTVLEGERGHLESLLAAARPGLGLKFRNLGWEGDTVFEQPRDVNFPDLTEQLRHVGATVIVCRFGRFEARAGREGLDRFVAAYDALCGRLSKQTPRLVLITPDFFAKPRDPLLPDVSKHNADVKAYANAVLVLAQRRKLACVNLGGARIDGQPSTENGVRWTPAESGREGLLVVKALGLGDWSDRLRPDDAGRWPLSELELLRQAVIAKNKLWFHYNRPMNWAFLGGDRVQVASSRDHRDPNVRWFPGEMEKFEPLIAEAERNVDEAARRANAALAKN